MARGRHTELLDLAIADLRQSGFIVTVSRGDAPYGRNVRSLRKGVESEMALIQTRSNKPDSSRYIIGIILRDLARVDSVVLWFEDEANYLHIPSEFLQGIHQDAQDRGIARYTGTDNQQWRIDVHLDEQTISPQGSDGERHSVSEYIILGGELPPS